MEILIKVIHILISVLLIFIVLLQSGKGASMGAAFGGTSSQALFGATGSNNFMTKLTTFVAVLFIITCLTLAYMSSHMATSSLMSDVKTEEAPAAPAVPTGMPGTETMPPPVEASPMETGAETPAATPPLERAPESGTHEGHDHSDHEGHNHP